PHANRKRTLLTPEECAAISNYAREKDLRVWLLINIFFHSGARRTEMFRLQGKDVDLPRQVLTCEVKKGQGHKFIPRPIKDIAVPFWEAALAGCAPDDFVFGRGLRPGPKSLGAEWITRWWRGNVK